MTHLMCILARVDDIISVVKCRCQIIAKSDIISMAIPNRLIGGTYHIFLAHFLGLCFRKYPQKIWPNIWYVYVPPF